MATNTCSSVPTRMAGASQTQTPPDMWVPGFNSHFSSYQEVTGQRSAPKREGSSLITEVFTIFLPDLLVLSPQCTPFFPEEIQHPATPLPHFQTVPILEPVPCLPSPPPQRHTASPIQINSPWLQDQPSDRYHFTSWDNFSLFPLSWKPAKYLTHCIYEVWTNQKQILSMLPLLLSKGRPLLFYKTALKTTYGFFNTHCMQRSTPTIILHKAFSSIL